MKDYVKSFEQKIARLLVPIARLNEDEVSDVIELKNVLREFFDQNSFTR